MYTAAWMNLKHTILYWMNLKHTILYKVSLIQKSTYCIIPFIQSFRIGKSNMMIEIRTMVCWKEELEWSRKGIFWDDKNVLYLEKAWVHSWWVSQSWTNNVMKNYAFHCIIRSSITLVLRTWICSKMTDILGTNRNGILEF